MADREEITYKSLRRIQQAEQTSSGLTRIDSNFYRDVEDYFQNLEHSIGAEKNPLKLKLFSDEISNTKKIINNIYELREKKIVQFALSTVRGGSPDLKNIIESERNLFDAIVAQITSSRQQVFEHRAPRSMKEPLKGSQLTAPASERLNKNPIVRVVEDTPEFIGTDEKTYVLRREDVLSLPGEMADPLIKKGVVKQVK